MKVIFITGAGRSGSTLLDLILGELDQCFSIGEFRGFFKNFLRKKTLCSCGEYYERCNFWSEVIYRVFNKLEFTSAELEFLYRLRKIVEHIPIINRKKQKTYFQKYNSEIKKFKEIYYKLYNQIFEITGCQIIIDSSKLPQYLLILNELNIETCLIHIVRDSRAVAYSWLRNKFDFGSNQLMKKHNPVTSARLWLMYNLQIEKIKKYYFNYYLLRYEDFCLSPLDKIKEAFKKFNININNLGKITDDTNTFKIKKEKHLVGGNPIRYKVKDTLKIKCDNEWQNKLKFKDKFLVTLITFPLLKKYQYI